MVPEFVQQRDADLFREACPPRGGVPVAIPLRVAEVSDSKKPHLRGQKAGVFHAPLGERHPDVQAQKLFGFSLVEAHFLGNGRGNAVVDHNRDFFKPLPPGLGEPIEFGLQQVVKDFSLGGMHGAVHGLTLSSSKRPFSGDAGRIVRRACLVPHRFHMLLATNVRNPAEPVQAGSDVRPAELVAMGYQGIVLFETIALLGLTDPAAAPTEDTRRWAEALGAEVDAKVADSVGAGLEVYLCIDAPALPAWTVQARPDRFTCRRRNDVLCPARESMGSACVSLGVDLLDRWPQAAGLVLRVGDSDVEKLPHLVGSNVYAPRCGRCEPITPVQRVLALTHSFHDAVVKERKRKLILRGWNLADGLMHEDPAIAAEIAAGLPGHPGEGSMILSFKHTAGDFRRDRSWNASSLAVGDWPVLYELQCQREYEGKGGIPNWLVPLWAHGDEKAPPLVPMPGSQEDPPSSTGGLVEVHQRANLAGVMSWVRGGGWGGPFVSDPVWIDANAWAIPRLLHAIFEGNPQPEAGLAETWARERLGLGEEAAAAVAEVLMASSEMVRQGFYFRTEHAPPPADAAARPATSRWVSDDLVDVNKLARLIDRLPEDQLDRAVASKAEAAATATRLRLMLQNTVGAASGSDASRLRPLVSTLVYTESLFRCFHHLTAGLVARRRNREAPGTAAHETARKLLEAAVADWMHHTQRHANALGSATAFREVGLYEATDLSFVPEN